MNILKKALLLLVLIGASCLLHAQHQDKTNALNDKTLYGQFIVDGILYKYTFRQGVAGNALQISNLEKPDAAQNEEWKLVQLLKAESQKILKDVKDNIDTIIRYSISNQIDTAIKKGSITLPDSAKTAYVNTLTSYYIKKKQTILDTIKSIYDIRDTRMKQIIQDTFIAERKEISDKLDSVISIISTDEETELETRFKTKDIYTKLLPDINKYIVEKLKIHTDKKGVTEKDGEKEGIFPHFEIAAFKVVFKNKMNTLLLSKKTSGLTAPAISEMDAQVEHTAQKVFYEIETRLKFIDEESITAFAILKKKHITLTYKYDTTSAEEQDEDALSRKERRAHNRMEKATQKTDIKEKIEEEKKKINDDISFSKREKRAAKKLSKVTIKADDDDDDEIEQDNPEFKVNFEVERVQMEFDAGTIKNVFIDLVPIFPEYQEMYHRHSVRFRNNKPVSVAGKFDADRIQDHWIYMGNDAEFEDVLANEIKKRDGKMDMEAFLQSEWSYDENGFRLSELVDLKVVPENNKEDYSPADVVIELTPTNVIINCKKEKTTRILDARTYSDVLALGGSEPNGMLQIEVSKKINLLTQRWQGIVYFPFPVDKDQYGYRTVPKAFSKPTNYSGIFTSIEPKFTLARVETSNRYLYLDSNSIDKIKSFDTTRKAANHFKVGILDAIQYQRWNAGVDINLLKYNLHNLRTEIQLNGNFAYGMTAIADSVSILRAIDTTNKFTHTISYTGSEHHNNVSTTQFGLGLVLGFKPLKQFNIQFGYDWRWVDMQNPNFILDNSFRGIYHIASANGYITLNGMSKLFFRFRKYWLYNMPEQNFYQIHLGYELDIFKNK